MGRLVNELSWSRSRISTLRNCKRQYYYQYYLKWEGWGWDAPEDRKRAYFFSKMTNLPMLVGHAVHETIKRILEDVRDHGEIRLENPSDYVRRELLSGPWRAAEKEMWRRSMKDHPPIFELYYDGMKPPAEILKGLGMKASDCVDRFLKDPLFAELSSDDASRWLAVDEGPQFDDESKMKLDGRTIWALPDFARKNADGQCEIWDWKTGRPSPHDEQQLLSYALYARDRWGFAAEEIRVFGLYLAEGQTVEYPCDSERLTAMEATIRADFVEMEGLLKDVDQNVPGNVDTDFPQIEDRDQCRKCLFKELCDR